MGDLDLAADPLSSRHSEAIELTDKQRQAPNLQGMGRRTANDCCWGSGGRIQVA
ncbi:hypothetical protein [Neisseria shayeganii]|uniref:Uncharacterized protein n=1 Tax=Neisseria shayeganii TaxID=607712 RepID=A0A7D7NC03_9NEIS|nr:hypothetical protein [Neisseria shayeganii]QMT40975.1 hypothetical protein H3L94_02670 [Neisseria shayeganii]